MPWWCGVQRSRTTELTLAAGSVGRSAGVESMASEFCISRLPSAGHPDLRVSTARAVIDKTRHRGTPDGGLILTGERGLSSDGRSPTAPSRMRAPRGQLCGDRAEISVAILNVHMHEPKRFGKLALNLGSFAHRPKAVIVNE